VVKIQQAIGKLLLTHKHKTMNEFQQVCSYVHSNLKANFENYDEALIAFKKHKSRMIAQDDSDDKLKAFHNKYIKNRKIARRRELKPQKWYNFTEVKAAIKKNKLWGIQIFDSRNICGDSMETIYCKDGITIDYAYGYGYIEVFGLNQCDYVVLEKAYQECTGYED
jgi:hypothetical protein